MHFDLIDLRLFIHVAEASSLTGGDRQAHISTAAASIRIKALEGQLGSRLFYRSSQGMELTPAGKRLLLHARTILRQVEYTKNEFSGYVDGGAGHIRVFANTTAVTEFMPEVLSRFLAKRPGVTVDLQERLTRDIIRGVLDGSTDFGIVAGEIHSKGLEILPFFTDRLVLVLPDKHPLAKFSRVDFYRTLTFHHISLHDGSTLLKFLREKVEGLGGVLTLRTQVYSFEAVCRMVEAGIGVSILPESSALRYQKTMHISLVRLNEAWAKRERSIVLREFEALPICGQELVDAICGYEGWQCH